MIRWNKKSKEVLHSSEKMNSVNYGKLDAIPRLQLFNCAECGARFTRQWRLREHETAHTRARPLQCPVPGCGRRFSRRSHLSRHNLNHTGAKQFRCSRTDCSSRFFNVDNLKRHVLYVHGNKDAYFKCRHPECHAMFRKRRMYKMHLKEHGISPSFRCNKEGCGAEFDSCVARRAHEKTHAGYSCPVPDCPVVEPTWGRMCRHAQTHPDIHFVETMELNLARGLSLAFQSKKSAARLSAVSYTCKRCQASFGRREALRRHRRRHALQKPVLLCPREGCQTYFSTTFNLQHHIRKAHLQLLKYRCAFPACERAFAMRESLNRHMVHHDPHGASLKKRWRSSKKWQKRLKGRQHRPLVEEDLRRLFALRLRFPRRAKVEADLSGLFNERKIPRLVSPEVNLHDLFSLKAPASQAPPVEA
ncbi:P43 5S RNA-binding protein-like isoform X2 [Conger conger]|uniref:P43 5S RNA-binding protein-like isoform X2 n=1 Tax=Conger conger TaxID=82655 RepID=UPI002A5B0D83|nr:P43 5S RNA-binding protein-like isoform X2 [Conger conger]